MKSIIGLAFILAVASAYELRAEEMYERGLYVPVVSEAIDGRITNGKNATTNQFPYQVGLLLKTDNGTKWCGGSLIGQNWVLSAAHCIETVTSVKVSLGATVRTNPAIIYNVSRSDIIVHPSWDKKTTQNDISLIRIPSANYTAAIQPVALPKIASSYPTYEGESVIASGWGRTSDTSNSPASTLQYVNMTVISNAVCKESYNGISASNICTATTGGISTCNGDSGGPLVLASSKVQVGLTSFISGAGCALGYPAAFTRLTNYLDWILQETGITG